MYSHSAATAAEESSQEEQAGRLTSNEEEGWQEACKRVMIPHSLPEHEAKLRIIAPFFLSE